MPDIIIIPNRGTTSNPVIQFSGSASSSIRMEVLPDGSIAFMGASGSLFGISDSLSGSLMSVSDISGLPILEVFSDDRVVMGAYNRNTLIVTGSSVGIRKVPNAGVSLDVSGSVFITGSLAAPSITGSLLGTASFSNVSSTTTTAATASFISLATHNNSVVGTGIISSSAQTLVALQSSNVNSGSAQTLVSLQGSGIASSSAQVVSLVSNQQISPAGITSSLLGTASTASFISLATFKNATVSSGIISGSAQTLVSLQGSNINSSSAQTLVSLQSSGIASSSTQIVTLVSGQQISPGGITSSLFGTSSWANNVATAQTASFISLSTFKNATLASGIISSSAQTLVALQGSNINSGSAQTLVSLQGSSVVSSSVQVVSLISGQQISPTGITSSLLGTASTASFISLGTFKNATNGTGIVSSSAQTLVALQGSNINSGSAQTLVSLQGSSIVSSSTQTVALISGQQISPTGVTASLFGTSSWSANSITANTASFISLATFKNATISSGIISGSAQTLVALQGSSINSGSAQTLVSLQGSNINSGSAQTLVSLQSSNVVSSSAQVVTLVAGQQISPSGVTSSLFGTASWATNIITAQTASFISLATFKNATLASGIISSSAQTLVALQGSNINSGSAQTLVSLQGSGIASSSAQVVTLVSGQQISPTGVTSSIFGTASWANNATNATNATTATNVAYTGVTGITSTSQFAGTASYATTAGTISLATFKNATTGQGIISSSAQTLVALQSSNINSSSAQTLVSLQGSSVVSSSAQVVTLVSGQQISPAGVTSSLFGTASWSNNSTTATTATTATNVAYTGVTGITTTSQFAGTASYATTAGTISLATFKNATTGQGIISSSAQTLVSLQSSNINSSSAQTLVSLQASSVVSSSTQIVNLISGQQISPAGITSSLLGTASTASFISLATHNNSVVGTGIISSSAQTLVALQGSNINSGSAQTLVSLQGSNVNSSSAQTLIGLQGSNVASSSAQVVSLISGQQISPGGITSSLFGTSSYAVRALSASWAPSGDSVSASYATSAATASYALNGSSVGGATSSADVTLTATSVPVHVITPSVYGISVKLPDATTCTKKAALFTVTNAGDFDLIIKNSAGTIKGFIPPFGTAVVGLADNSTAAGVWSLAGAREYGTSAGGHLTGLGLYNVQGYVTNPDQFNVIDVDADRQMLIFSGSSLYAVVYNKTTRTWGAVTLIRSSSEPRFGAVVMDTDKVVLASWLTTAFEAVCLSLSGTTITVNSAATKTLGASSTTRIGVEKIGSSGISIYNQSGNVALLAFTLSGTTVTIGSETTFSGANFYTLMFPLEAGVVLISQTGVCNYFGVSGTTITAGTSATRTNSATFIRAVQLTPTKWMSFLYVSAANSEVVIFSLSGTTISVSSPATIATGANRIDLNSFDLVQISSTKVAYIIGYTGSDSLRFNIATESAGSVSVGTPLLYYSTATPNVAGRGSSGNEARFSVNNNYYRIDCSGSSPTFAGAAYAESGTTRAYAQSNGTDLYGDPIRLTIKNSSVQISLSPNGFSYNSVNFPLTNVVRYGNTAKIIPNDLPTAYGANTQAGGGRRKNLAETWMGAGPGSEGFVSVFKFEIAQ